ncbi:hypothetical protein [Kosakonia radicincitans]|uniref:hypothetical protein n=1 Tax=Kosakonia radicincitans TaxID=283686 RepID=UPI001D07ED66|nr:hypothetical protein [Kosakonia radicincitans]
MVSTDRLYGIRTSVAVKPAVTAFATTNVTLYGEQTITMNSAAVTKTVTTTEGMRILLAGQDNPIDNGIWEAKIATWVRAPDFNGPRDVVNGTLVFSIYGDCWQVECDDMPVIIGTSSLTFRSTFPFSDADDLFQRSLRVPDSFILPMPPLSQLEGMLIAIASGRPVGVLPGTGTASDVMIELAKPTGYTHIGGIFKPDNVVSVDTVYGGDLGLALSSVSEGTTLVLGKKLITLLVITVRQGIQRKIFPLSARVCLSMHLTGVSLLRGRGLLYRVLLRTRLKGSRFSTSVSTVVITYPRIFIL